jgi:hypothetical protein
MQQHENAVPRVKVNLSVMRNISMRDKMWIQTRHEGGMGAKAMTSAYPEYNWELKNSFTKRLKYYKIPTYS